jgi:hypothetical protein
MYTALAPTADIAYPVPTHSQYNTKSYDIHLTSVKRILRNLKTTANAKLVFSSTTLTDLPLVAYKTQTSLVIVQIESLKVDTS